ncbi:MAG: hypothetical protein J5794_07960 [Lachnospiraceae bacterium]|nr:hypothetical protein [Lachnospiraceae bacterium]
MSIAPRKTAVRIIFETVQKGRFLSDVLKEYVYEAIPSPSAEEQAAILFLTRGSLERKIELDAILSKLCTVPLKKLKKAVYAILLTASFELIHGNAPEYAVVHEYVGLSDTFGVGALKGFVNAVLRRLCREKEDLLAGLKPHEKLALPEWLYQAFTEWYGQETAERIGLWFLAEDSKRLTVRCLTSKVSEEAFENALQNAGISFRKSPVGEDVFELWHPGRIDSIPGRNEGWFYVEAPAMTCSVSAAFAHLDDSRTECRILDACASPGGKTIQFADGIRSRIDRNVLKSGSVTALDRSREKLRLLDENIRFYSFCDLAETGVSDAEVLHPEYSGRFDIVNLDVPCSGLGVLSGKPEAKERLTPEDLTNLTTIQKRILESGASCVREGGLLVYSTCTLNPAENTEQIDRFLQEHCDFARIEERSFLPGIEPTDGFYYAILRKNSHQ